MDETMLGGGTALSLNISGHDGGELLTEKLTVTQLQRHAQKKSLLMKLKFPFIHSARKLM